MADCRTAAAVARLNQFRDALVEAILRGEKTSTTGLLEEHREVGSLIGASGGVSGLLGGLVRFAFHRPLSRPSTAKGVLPLTDRSVLIWSAVVVAMNASIAIFGAGVGAQEGDIAWQAHVGGYLFGLAAFPLFDPKRCRPTI